MSDDANPIYHSLEAAKRQLRDCYWWRRLADVDDPWDEAESASHIYYDELPPSETGDTHSREELAELRPFALVWLDPQNGMTIQSDGSIGCCWATRGIVTIAIQIAVPDAMKDDPEALATWLHQMLGRIIRTCDPTKPGLADLASLSGYLPLNRIQFLGYLRADSTTATTMGDCVICEIELEWGSQ